MSSVIAIWSAAAGTAGVVLQSAQIVTLTAARHRRGRKATVARQLRRQLAAPG
jgi:hypothetical protein